MVEGARVTVWGKLEERVARQKRGKYSRAVKWYVSVSRTDSSILVRLPRCVQLIISSDVDARARACS